MTQHKKESSEKKYNYVTYRLSDAENLGIYAAILISEFNRRYNILACNKHVFKKECIDGWFHISTKDLVESTSLTGKQVLREIKNLIYFKILERKWIGHPPKIYYKFVEGGK